MNFAIIVAAGSGKRFGSEIPKQFLELCGKPVIFHTLERFEDCWLIDEVILVLAAAEADKFRLIIGNYNFSKLKTIVFGGQTRAESVYHGLEAIKSLKAKIVTIHDGARPLVTPSEIAKTIEKANETGAAVLVAPVTDTIKQISPDEKILKTIDRTTLRRALTPQCFDYKILKRAFAQPNILNQQATDESFLVEQLGIKISIVEGSSRNIKITMAEDLILAKALLEQSQI